MATTSATSALRVRVIPGSRRSELAWDEARGWVVRVAAPQVDGAANAEVCRFLAREVLGIAPSRVRVRSGAASRDKHLEIEADAEAVEAALRSRVGR